MIVRQVKRDDGQPLLAFMRDMVTEPNIGIPIAADEVSLDINDFVDKPRAAMFVADHEGMIVGQLSLRPVSQRRATFHITTLAMAVHRDWRRRGVGRALMAEAIEWAPIAGYTRIQLDVYERNTAAIRLYEQFGFQHEGRRNRFVREGDTYLDCLFMARLL